MQNHHGNFSQECEIVNIAHDKAPLYAIEMHNFRKMSTTKANVIFDQTRFNISEESLEFVCIAQQTTSFEAIEGVGYRCVLEMTSCVAKCENMIAS